MPQRTNPHATAPHGAQGERGQMTCAKPHSGSSQRAPPTLRSGDRCKPPQPRTRPCAHPRARYICGCAGHAAGIPHTSVYTCAMKTLSKHSSCGVRVQHSTPGRGMRGATPHMRDGAILQQDPICVPRTHDCLRAQPSRPCMHSTACGRPAPSQTQPCTTPALGAVPAARSPAHLHGARRPADTTTRQRDSCEARPLCAASPSTRTWPWRSKPTRSRECRPRR
jgi:hypothetical protein